MSTPSERLQIALNEYRKAESELTLYRQKVEIAQQQAQASIDDFEISDGQASTKLALAQVLRERLKSRDSELNKTLGELEQETTTVGLLLNSSVMDLWIKRRETLGRRAVEALQAPRDLFERGILDEALSYSGPLLAVRELGVVVYSAQHIEKVHQLPVQMITTNVNGLEVQEEVTSDRQPVISQELDIQHLIASAEQVLANFEKLSDETKREI